MRRRQKKRDQGSVEMNLAAMLDMAVQLLTFFILTFKPAPIEGQLALHMPPPVEHANVKANPPDNPGMGKQMQPNLETLHLQVTANGSGEIGQVSVEQTAAVQGPMTTEGLQILDQKLQQIFSIQHVPFDRVQISVDGQLHYGELMKVIDVCSRQKRFDGEQIRKISFAEL